MLVYGVLGLLVGLVVCMCIGSKETRRGDAVRVCDGFSPHIFMMFVGIVVLYSNITKTTHDGTRSNASDYSELSGIF